MCAVMTYHFSSSALWPAKSSIKSPFCTSFTMVSCPFRSGPEPGSCPAVMPPSLAFSTPSFTSWCISITWCQPWAPNTKSTCGGNSTWRRFKWSNSWDHGTRLSTGFLRRLWLPLAIFLLHRCSRCFILRFVLWVLHCQLPQKEAFCYQGNYAFANAMFLIIYFLHEVWGYLYSWYFQEKDVRNGHAKKNDVQEINHNDVKKEKSA